MAIDRHLAWEGSFNARDLGGLRAAAGRVTRWRAVVRSERPDGFTAAGWSALWAHGVRTIVDLRGDEERETAVYPHAPKLTIVHLALEDETDTAFWQRWRDSGLWATPLYYSAFLDRWPERCAAAVATIARARPGGVLVCCGHGRDRTGLVVMLLLALAGVAPEEIVADYEVSAERLRPFCARLGHGDESDQIEALLAREQTTARAAILDTLASLDIEARLRAGGLTDDDLAALCARLLGPEGSTDPSHDRHDSQPLHHPRAGWDEAFRRMAEHGDDCLIDDGWPMTDFDMVVWQW